MSDHATTRPRRHPIAPFAAVWLVAAAAVVGSLLWSTQAVNKLARERQAALVAIVIKDAVAQVGHVQESSTYWDDSLVQVTQRPLDMDWLDANLGEWFHEYAGHDEVYIVDEAGKPIYAMRGGQRAATSSFAQLAGVATPLLQRLRATKEIAKTPELDVAMLTPGIADLARVRGHLAIVSMKMLATDTGDLENHPGTHYVHISVLYLDDDFLTGIAREYGLVGPRILREAPTDNGSAAFPLRDSQGRTLGFFAWQPFAPGSDVRANAGPFLVAMLLALGAALMILARQLKGATSALAQRERQAHHRANHDPLTELPNRSAFERRLWSSLADRDGIRRGLALLYVDIDHFKQVNDQFGHAAGDALLCEVATRLRSAIDAGDEVFRIGGDEFAILLHASPAQHEVEIVCQRIVEWVRQPFAIGNAQAHVGASIGIARSPEQGRDPEELARKADVALYRAKSEGRGRFVLHTGEMDVEVNTRATFARDIRAALDGSGEPDGALSMVYQPIFRASDSKLVGVEALLRWQHPHRGLLTPDAFAEQAEQSGTIIPLGLWVLRRALAEARSWQGLRLAINVSPTQLASPEFYAEVCDALAETGVEAHRLEFDLTEASLLSARGPVADTVARLRAEGISIALDDFGTGFSSLSHIRDVVVDRVKIDHAFIAASNSPKGLALVQAISTMAAGYGLRVTAEGVEHAWQEEVVRSIGCEEMQGFYLAEPMSAERIADFLTSPQARRKPSGGAQVA